MKAMLVAGVLVAVMSISSTLGLARQPQSHGATTPTIASAPSCCLFGTMFSNPTHTRQEYRAGVRLAHLVVPWDRYEPREGVFNPTYYLSLAHTYAANGMKIILAPDMSAAPDWVFSYPNSHYVNQYGVSQGGVNLTFSATMRQKAQAFISNLVRTIGPSNIFMVNVGYGQSIELTLPAEYDGTHGNSYWAYDNNAQRGGSDLPATVEQSPFPGWHPGDTSYNGQPFTTAQVGRWLDWYVSSADDVVNWQIALYRQLGFNGLIGLLMPGIGTRPYDYQQAIANYLDGTGDRFLTLGRAAVFWKTLDQLTRRDGIVTVQTGLGDNSGGRDLCQPDDQAISITDPRTASWSGTRLVARYAAQYNLPKFGETPGPVPGANLTTLRTAAAQMLACGLFGMNWAFDNDLYDPTTGIKLADYSAEIAAYNAAMAKNTTKTAAPAIPMTCSSPPAPHATATPVPQRSIAGLLMSPIRLNGSTVPLGGTISATVTFRNTSSGPLSVPQLAIAARPPGGTHVGGPFYDLGPYVFHQTIAAGATLTVTASRSFAPNDPLGTYEVYSTFEDAAGNWHDAQQSGHFTVVHACS